MNSPQPQRGHPVHARLAEERDRDTRQDEKDAERQDETCEPRGGC